MFHEVCLCFPAMLKLWYEWAWAFYKPTLHPSLPLLLRLPVCFLPLLRARASALVLECMLKRRDQSASVCAAGMKGFVRSRGPVHVASPYAVLSSKQRNGAGIEYKNDCTVFKASTCVSLLRWIWHRKLTVWWNVSTKCFNERNYNTKNTTKTKKMSLNTSKTQNKATKKHQQQNQRCHSKSKKATTKSDTTKSHKHNTKAKNQQHPHHKQNKTKTMLINVKVQEAKTENITIKPKTEQQTNNKIQKTTR